MFTRTVLCINYALLNYRSLNRDILKTLCNKANNRNVSSIVRRNILILWTISSYILISIFFCFFDSLFITINLWIKKWQYGLSFWIRIPLVMKIRWVWNDTTQVKSLIRLLCVKATVSPNLVYNKYVSQFSCIEKLISLVQIVVKLECILNLST